MRIEERSFTSPAVSQPQKYGENGKDSHEDAHVGQKLNRYMV